MSDAKQASTSHAHSVEPVKDGKLGESSKTLGDQFAKAKAAQLQKQAAAKTQPAPDMSFARTVDPVNDNKLASASQDMRGQFERAKAAQVAKGLAEKPAMKAPAPAPGMHLKPGGNLQRQVDGPIQRKELSDYAKHLKGLNESAKARQAGQNQAELKNERGKDNDRGR